MNRRVDVVALIIARGDEVLVERRRLDRKTDPGAVTIPGGHVEEGETFEEACRRELMEELGLECARLRYLATYLHETTVEDQVTRYYVCEDWTGSRAHRSGRGILHRQRRGRGARLRDRQKGLGRISRA
jgi:mutator protein MutT